MKTFQFIEGAAQSTSLGYGTTSLLALPTTKDRLRLLDAAFDVGIRHVDTAPYYGYGEAERLVGDFASGKRDKITITTKFGIQPPSLVKSRWVNLLARRVLKYVPALRRSISNKANALTQKGDFNPEVARRSLDQSLLSLKTDYIDLFLLHEPELSDAASEPIIQFLEEEVKRGRIRAYGCGGEIEQIHAIAQTNLFTSRWLQFEDNVMIRNLELIQPSGAQCITYRTFHSGLARLTNWLEQDEKRASEWQRRLQLDLKEKGTLSSLMLASSMERNKKGIVLFSSSKEDRIHEAATLAAGLSYTQDQLLEFDRLSQSIGLIKDDPKKS